MGSLASAALAIAMLAAFALLIGGAKLVRQPENRTRGALMFGAAAVLIGNVAIWTL